MIIWASKPEPETRGDHMPCSAFRWTLQFAWWRIGFIHQHQQKDTGEWIDSHTSIYEARIGGPLRLGRQHVYYDGPHCSLYLGFLHFYWGGWNGWCEKCMPSMDE